LLPTAYVHQFTPLPAAQSFSCTFFADFYSCLSARPMRSFPFLFPPLFPSSFFPPFLFFFFLFFFLFFFFFPPSFFCFFFFFLFLLNCVWLCVYEPLEFFPLFFSCVFVCSRGAATPQYQSALLVLYLCNLLGRSYQCDSGS